MRVLNEVRSGIGCEADNRTTYFVRDEKQMKLWALRVSSQQKVGRNVNVGLQHCIAAVLAPTPEGALVA